MNAQQLTDAITTARQDHFGDNFGYPPEFFDDGVTVTEEITKTVAVRSPMYCATSDGGQQISDVISGALGFSNQIVLRPALFFGGWTQLNMHGFFDNKEVPYLLFKSQGDSDTFTGPQVNAGILLQYFNHGSPAARALDAVAMEIMAAFANTPGKTPSK